MICETMVISAIVFEGYQLAMVLLSKSKRKELSCTQAEMHSMLFYFLTKLKNNKNAGMVAITLFFKCLKVKGESPH